MDLRQFRKDNNLTQDQLGDYLGIKKSFISKVEHGREKLPEERLQKLTDNDMGWDVAALHGEDVLDVTSILNRLCSFFNIRTDSDLSGVLGYAGATAIAYWRTQNTIDLRRIMKAAPNIDLNWLIYGEEKPKEQDENKKKSVPFHKEAALNILCTILTLRPYQAIPDAVADAITITKELVKQLNENEL